MDVLANPLRLAKMEQCLLTCIQFQTAEQRAGAAALRGADRCFAGSGEPKQVQFSDTLFTTARFHQ
jgi:hypothetical protein